MVKAANSSALVSVAAVLDSFRMQGIAFRGPFNTPAKHTVFVVEGYILLESELVDLLMQNKLNRDDIRVHCERIQAAASKVDLLPAQNPTR